MSFSPVEPSFRHPDAGPGYVLATGSLADDYVKEQLSEQKISSPPEELDKARLPGEPEVRQGPGGRKARVRKRTQART
jgi:hypothetical protein